LDWKVSSPNPPRKGKIAGHEMGGENVLRGFENAKIKHLEKMLGRASKET